MIGTYKLVFKFYLTGRANSSENGRRGEATFRYYSYVSQPLFHGNPLIIIFQIPLRGTSLHINVYWQETKRQLVAQRDRYF